MVLAIFPGSRKKFIKGNKHHDTCYAGKQDPKYRGAHNGAQNQSAKKSA